MAKAANKVIAGDYREKHIVSLSRIEKGKWTNTQVIYPAILIDNNGKPFKVSEWTVLPLNRNSVVVCEVVSDDHETSTGSAITRGLVGGALFGGVGAVAAAMTAKEKGIYRIAVQFSDGKKSLLEVDDKFYKMIVAECF